jgi:putative salt-induced outer membrane protein
MQMMMTTIASVWMLLALLLLPHKALAQWQAKAEAGLVMSHGNTETESANAKVDVSREFVKWKHLAGLTGVYASDEIGATGQRWEARAQTEYKFTPKGFWFGSGRYEEDRFSGIAYQATYGTGIGYRFFDSDITKLSAQIGGGYKVSESRATIDDDGVTFIPSERTEEAIAQASVNYEHTLTETTKIVDKLLVESGADNTFTQNDLSVQVKILGSLALAAGYAVRYNSNPPDGFRSTDTLTTLNLVYELK